MGTDNVSENGSEHCRDTMKSEVMDPCAPCSQFDVVSFWGFCFCVKYLCVLLCILNVSVSASDICICTLKTQLNVKKTLQMSI